MVEELLRLYTIQPQALWDTLQKEGITRVDSWRTEKDFSQAYQWLKLQMKKRVRGYRGGDLFWAWAEKPPFEEYYQWGNPGEPKVCLELLIPKKRVLLSDFDLWHHVLNGWYLCLSEKESERLWKRKMTSSFRREQSKSWEKIFDLTLADKYLDWLGGNVRVQATFEYFRRDEVVSVEYFESGIK